MSHFAVLVIGNDVERQLAPYHEFECTGDDNEFVVEVDITEEARTEYEESTESKFRDPQGNLHDPYEDRFYRDPTPDELKAIGPIGGTGVGGGLFGTSKDWSDGRGYRAKVHFVPDGWTEVRFSGKDVRSFAAWIEDNYGKHQLGEHETPDFSDDGDHKYGYYRVASNGNRGIALDGDMGPTVLSVVRRTNPNKKWDYWRVGGRWGGFFLLKSNATSKAIGRDDLAWEHTFSQEDRDASSELLDGRHADSALKRDVDIEAMRAAAGREYGQRWDAFRALIGDATFETFDVVRARHDDDGPAYDEYWKQSAIERIRKKREFAFEDRRSLDALIATNREDYVQRGRNNALVTFAVVKDGKWYERGKMGWWACVSNEKDRDEWVRQFSELIDGVSDDTLLTVVDCHI